MSVKAMMATILRSQLTLHGVHSLRPSDWSGQSSKLRELELSLAARELAQKQEP
jgi:hypothetical protein